MPADAGGSPGLGCAVRPAALSLPMYWRPASNDGRRADVLLAALAILEIEAGPVAGLYDGAWKFVPPTSVG